MKVKKQCTIHNLSILETGRNNKSSNLLWSCEPTHFTWNTNVKSQITVVWRASSSVIFRFVGLIACQSAIGLLARSYIALFAADTQLRNDYHNPPCAPYPPSLPLCKILPDENNSNRPPIGCLMHDCKESMNYA